jgi:hypothetical protein
VHRKMTCMNASPPTLSMICTDPKVDLPCKVSADVANHYISSTNFDPQQCSALKLAFPKYVQAQRMAYNLMLIPFVFVNAPLIFDICGSNQGSSALSRSITTAQRTTRINSWTMLDIPTYDLRYFSKYQTDYTSYQLFRQPYG